jgi:flagellar hook-associated protein 2
MITQIQLGNIFNENGRNVVGGSASGIDVEALITGLTGARRQPAVILESTIEKNDTTAEALGDLEGLLDNLRDAADFLRNPPGVQNAASNVFKYRSANVSSNTAVTGSNYLSVTSEPGTATGVYDITVNQLATRAVHTTNTFALATADTAVVGSGAGDALRAGALVLGASGVTVNLVNGDTLNQVVAKINAAKDTSGVEAVAIKVSNGNYRLSLRTTETGAAQNYVPTAATFSNVGFAINDVAVDSSITLDGTTITRSKNNIDDIVDGMTFNLQQVTPMGTELEVEVEADTELAKNGISNFINAYNELRFFAARQTQTGDDGKALEGSVLYSNSVLTLTRSRVEAEISAIVDGITAGDPSRLSDLGITFDDFPGDDETPFTRNILVVDEAKLDSVLASNFEAVRKVFEFDYTSDNPDLQIFERTNALDVSAFQLSIDQTLGVYQATYDDDGNALTPDVTVLLDGTPVTSGTGVILKGRAGTVLEGMTMIYGAAGNATVNVAISQGIGDRVFNTVDNLLDEDTGALGVELRSLSDKNDRIQRDIERIDSQIEAYRERLLRQYSELERAITAANTLLESLDAQSRAQSGN